MAEEIKKPGIEEVRAKRDDEKKTVTLMIQLYCHGFHKTRKAMKSPEFMCPDCKALSEYVNERIEKCPFTAKGTKTFCSFCKVHCYKPEMREKIRNVMRYSGPRIIFYHPVKAFRHLALTLREKRKAR
ncbi:MAG: nitrous oxide-stimulated promoter family protein [Treponemataceae bacterium]|nr:nitrous oxide-stimulated promoter family protein [Treponemataceae bacterium]